MADLWTRPASTPYRFATDSGVRLEPIAGRKAAGWVPGEPVSALQANDLWGVASDWVVLLEAIAPADGTLAAQALELYDTAGTPALAATWTAGSVADSALLTVGAVGWEWRTTGMVGPLAVAGADGGRFGYDSTDLLNLVHGFGPATGGYMPLMGSAPALPPFFLVSGGSVKIYNPNAAPYDCALRRPVLCPYDPAMTGPGRFPKIVTLSATFTGAATDLGVRLIRIQRSTGAETIEGTITRAAPTYTFAGSGLVLDPEFRDYCIEVFSAGLAGTTPTTDTVRAIQLAVAHALLLPVM